MRALNRMLKPAADGLGGDILKGQSVSNWILSSNRENKTHPRHVVNPEHNNLTPIRLHLRPLLWRARPHGRRQPLNDTAPRRRPHRLKERLPLHPLLIHIPSAQGRALAFIAAATHAAGLLRRRRRNHNELEVSDGAAADRALHVLLADDVEGAGEARRAQRVRAGGEHSEADGAPRADGALLGVRRGSRCEEFRLGRRHAWGGWVGGFTHLLVLLVVYLVVKRTGWKSRGRIHRLGMSMSMSLCLLGELGMEMLLDARAIEGVRQRKTIVHSKGILMGHGLGHGREMRLHGRQGGLHGRHGGVGDTKTHISTHRHAHPGNFLSELFETREFVHIFAGFLRMLFVPGAHGLGAKECSFFQVTAVVTEIGAIL